MAFGSAVMSNPPRNVSYDNIDDTGGNSTLPAIGGNAGSGMSNQMIMQQMQNMNHQINDEPVSPPDPRGRGHVKDEDVVKAKGGRW